LEGKSEVELSDVKTEEEREIYRVGPLWKINVLRKAPSSLGGVDAAAEKLSARGDSRGRRTGGNATKAVGAVHGS